MAPPPAQFEDACASAVKTTPGHHGVIMWVECWGCSARNAACTADQIRRWDVLAAGFGGWVYSELGCTGGLPRRTCSPGVPFESPGALASQVLADAVLRPRRQV